MNTVYTLKMHSMSGGVSGETRPRQDQSEWTPEEKRRWLMTVTTPSVTNCTWYYKKLSLMCVRKHWYVMCVKPRPLLWKPWRKIHVLLFLWNTVQADIFIRSITGERKQAVGMTRWSQPARSAAAGTFSRLLLSKDSKEEGVTDQSQRFTEAAEQVRKLSGF